jgi:hypothetical protein
VSNATRPYYAGRSLRETSFDGPNVAFSCAVLQHVNLIVQREEPEMVAGVGLISALPHPFGADLRSVCLALLGSNLRSGSRRIMSLEG